MEIQKVAAVTALHYGIDYLEDAIKSVIDAVDEFHILYSARPCHTVQTDEPCPESREELYQIAERAAGSKLIWHDGNWLHEGQQRDAGLLADELAAAFGRSDRDVRERHRL